jgi:hypothetical protein
VSARLAARIRALLTFQRLEVVSFIHSLVYLALLICAFAAGQPQPETFILGLSHGLLWIGMSCVCILAARLRIVPMRLAVAVAVLGGIGPFFGSAEFVREQRRRRRAAAHPRPSSPAIVLVHGRQLRHDPDRDAGDG